MKEQFDDCVSEMSIAMFSAFPFIQLQIACISTVRPVKALRLVLFVVLVTSVPQRSQADFVYAFNTQGTDQAFYSGPGAVVDVPIYLVQTGGENRLSTIGLFAAGASVTYTYGSGSLQSATVSSSFLASHWNDDMSNSNVHESNRVTMEGLINDVLFPAKATSDAVLLGTVRFQAGVLGNVTNLQLSLDRVTPFANSFVNATEVTPILFRSGSITSVPEPVSLIQVLFALVLGLRIRVRRD